MPAPRAEHAEAEALGTGVGGAEALERQQPKSEEAQRHHEEVRRAERGSVEPVRTKWLTVVGFWISVLLQTGIANLTDFLYCKSVSFFVGDVLAVDLSKSSQIYGWKICRQMYRLTHILYICIKYLNKILLIKKSAEACIMNSTIMFLSYRRDGRKAYIHAVPNTYNLRFLKLFQTL